jgi:UDP-3-O-[3-hydroxymyristoyl] glucosamine N-acyltransferase
MDGLVVIGHGSKLGAHGLLVAQVGVAGSVTVGHHVTMGGQVGIAGHLKIGDNVVIGAPAMPAAHARRVYTIFTQLPEVIERIKKLEEQVEELASGDDVLP